MMYKKTKEKIKLFMEEGIFSGVSFSFIDKQYSQDYTWGYAQISPSKEPLSTRHLFDVASLTKVVCTTTVVLQLVEKKIICLDKPFNTYYPFFKDKRVTIRHLLTHTADITGYIENRDELSKEELRAAYNQLKSGKNLAKRVSYTDTGMILLGFMLEELLKKDVVTIFKEHVLIPLEMEESTFLPKDITWIVPTENHQKRGLIRGKVHDPKAFILAEHAGNAGLFTHVNDLKKFVHMYLNAGSYKKRQLLSEETIRLLITDQTLNKQGKRSFGWDLKKNKGSSLLFHTGYTGTFLIIDIIKKEAFIFLSNRVHPRDEKEKYLEKREELLETFFQERD